MSTSGRAVRSIGLVLLGRAAGLAINAVALMLIVRLLGPERFGPYAVAFVFISFFTTVLDNSLNTTVARAIAAPVEAPGTILGTALALKTSAGVCLGLLAIAIAQLPAFAPDVRTLVPVGALLVPLAGLSVVNALFQVRLRMGPVIAGDIVTRVTFLVMALVVLVYAGAGVRGLFLVHVVAFSLGTAGVVMAASRAVDLRVSRDGALWRALGSHGVLLGLAFALGMLASRFDVLALSAFAGARASGLYSAAFRTIDLLLLLPGLVMQVLFPLLVGRAAGDAPHLEAGYRRIQDLHLLVGLPATVVLTVGAREILVFVAGPAYVDGAPWLASLAWGMLAVFLSTAMYHVLIAVGRLRTMLVCSAAGAATSIALALALVPRYGGQGAAWAAVGAHMVMLAGPAWVLWRRVGIRPWPRAIPEALAVSGWTGIALVAGQSVGTGLPVALGIAAIGGAGLLVAFPRTRQELRAALQGASPPVGD